MSRCIINLGIKTHYPHYNLVNHFTLFLLKIVKKPEIYNLCAGTRYALWTVIFFHRASLRFPTDGGTVNLFNEYHKRLAEETITYLARPRWIRFPSTVLGIAASTSRGKSRSWSPKLRPSCSSSPPSWLSSSPGCASCSARGWACWSRSRVFGLKTK